MSDSIYCLLFVSQMIVNKNIRRLASFAKLSLDKKISLIVPILNLVKSHRSLEESIITVLMKNRNYMI